VALAEGDGVEGRLVLSGTALDEDRQRLLTSFSYQASVALQKAHLYWQQLEAAEIANALLDASRELATAESPEDVLVRSVEVTARVLGTERAALWIQEDEPPNDLVARASHGYEPASDPVGTSRFTAAVAGEWLGTRTDPFVLEPEELARIESVTPEMVARFVIAPLHFDGNRVGALTATIGEGAFDERQLRLVAGLAHQARLAIENAEHYENLEQTFVSTVASLANALEANDAYTSSHARWITDMALLVGRELGLDRPALKRLELGALFHDIGKIGIPSEILQKPGPLTDAEFAIIREHPELGEKILAPIGRLADVRPIVRACHERWDGLGYPDAKAAAEIPIESRIVLVCDAYHAMVTDRPYRPCLPAAEAVRRLREAAGTQFDPRVVAAFLRLFEHGAIPPLD
jgi:HD-GYP domain-containing protein (c-di-GMP phosphodiesterase class II)